MRLPTAWLCGSLMVCVPPDMPGRFKLTNHAAAESLLAYGEVHYRRALAGPDIGVDQQLATFVDTDSAAAAFAAAAAGSGTCTPTGGPSRSSEVVSEMHDGQTSAITLRVTAVAGSSSASTTEPPAAEEAQQGFSPDTYVLVLARSGTHVSRLRYTPMMGPGQESLVSDELANRLRDVLIARLTVQSPDPAEVPTAYPTMQ